MPETRPRSAGVEISGSTEFTNTPASSLHTTPRAISAAPRIRKSRSRATSGIAATVRIVPIVKTRSSALRAPPRSARLPSSGASSATATAPIDCQVASTRDPSSRAAWIAASPAAPSAATAEAT